jgi:hypothetical protein
MPQGISFSNAKKVMLLGSLAYWRVIRLQSSSLRFNALSNVLLKA